MNIGEPIDAPVDHVDAKWILPCPNYEPAALPPYEYQDQLYLPLMVPPLLACWTLGTRSLKCPGVNFDLKFGGTLTVSSGGHSKGFSVWKPEYLEPWSLELKL